jgi:hypothetical protein
LHDWGLCDPSIKHCFGGTRGRERDQSYVGGREQHERRCACVAQSRLDQRLGQIARHLLVEWRWISQRWYNIFFSLTNELWVYFILFFCMTGLTPKDRAIVEELFVERAISMLCTTRTLALGVNLPAHLVIIKSMSFYSQSTASSVTYSDLDVLQVSTESSTEIRDFVVMFHCCFR